MCVFVCASVFMGEGVRAVVCKVRSTAGEVQVTATRRVRQGRVVWAVCSVERPRSRGEWGGGGSVTGRTRETLRRSGSATPKPVAHRGTTGTWTAGRGEVREAATARERAHTRKAKKRKAEAADRCGTEMAEEEGGEGAGELTTHTPNQTRTLHTHFTQLTQAAA